ncbi:MAG: hypothetical protein GPJ54_21760 [Candidatus Heimdallarchaeota archaeon]|nr:hypothetical protein [Candidatus Heimdallarchaeota archaeon]
MIYVKFEITVFLVIEYSSSKNKISLALLENHPELFITSFAMILHMVQLSTIEILISIGLIIGGFGLYLLWKIFNVLNKIGVSIEPKSEKKFNSGETINVAVSTKELWQSSKKARVALFIRSFFFENYWFSAKEVLEEQLTHTRSLVLGETSAIATYLARLFENGYLDRQKSSSRAVKYKLTEKMILEFPLIEPAQFNELLKIGPLE